MDIMIKGIGIDIIELKRIKKHIQQGNRLTERILTDQEMKRFFALSNQTRQVEFLAGRFAAKEAFAKATGRGIGKLSFKDINIVTAPNGQPKITAKGYETVNLFVSISHSQEYAIAQVIMEELP